MTRPFVLLGLPRSRTKWLSHWLSLGSSAPCGHDALLTCQDFSQFTQALRGGALCGSIETAGMLGWRLLRSQLPKCSIGVIRRHPDDVIESLRRNGWPPDVQEIYLRNELLNVIERLPGVKSWSFADLSDLEVGEEIWKFTRGANWDEDAFLTLCLTNIQINLSVRRQFIFNHGFELAQAKQLVAVQSAKLGNQACLRLQ